jgi:hypothetical protein
MGVSGTPGYGQDRDGKRYCYACCDRDEIASLRTADRFFAYLSADHNTVTTWTGGKLGNVTRYKMDSGRWTATQGTVHRCYVRVTDVHGNDWTGTGPVENGSYVRLRRVAKRGA